VCVCVFRWVVGHRKVGERKKIYYDVIILAVCTIE